MSYHNRKRPMALVMEYPRKRRAVVTSPRGSDVVEAALLAAGADPLWLVDHDGWAGHLDRVGDVLAALDAAEVHVTLGERRR